MDGPIIAYVKICVDPLSRPQRAISQKRVSLIIFIRILRFIWNFGLVSSDNPKDAVSGKILVFGNIFIFPEVNWAQSWTKTVKFGYVPFVLKHLILKYCSRTVFLLWWITSGPNFNKFQRYFGEKGPRTPQKGPFHGSCIATKTFENL